MHALDKNGRVHVQRRAHAKTPRGPWQLQGLGWHLEQIYFFRISINFSLIVSKSELFDCD